MAVPHHTATDIMSHGGTLALDDAPLASPVDNVTPGLSALPSTRQIELETLLRQRDAQNEQLTVEVTTLRRFLTKQPTPSTSEPVTLPPPLLSLLLPYLTDPLAENPSSASSNSVTLALTQRAKRLQEENDELYELLTHSETGRLKEEVRGLRRAVRRMESALKVELDKCYETFSRSSDLYTSSGPSQGYSETSGNPRAQTNHAQGSAASVKPIPTGPRAQKRPRLSHASLSPQQPPAHRNSVSPRRNHTVLPPTARHSSKMEIDEDSRGRGRASPDRDRHRERGRDRDRERTRDIPPHQPSRKSRERDHEREREYERERDRDRGGRRNGGGGRDRRGARGLASTNGTGNRGLAERMGL
ncbi:hypothetical protein K439DRAFT_9529 [Ramaria rubella]|nr:hypothetical protein K439DRAFT_9529 [Ramaria rubella]